MIMLVTICQKSQGIEEWDFNDFLTHIKGSY